MSLFYQLNFYIVDTDSAITLLPDKNMNLPLDLHQSCIGSLKDEIPLEKRIAAFFGLSAKTYSLLISKKGSYSFVIVTHIALLFGFLDSDEIVDSLMRAKGFHLDSKNPLTRHVNSNLIQNYVLALQSGKKLQTDVLQKRFKIDVRTKNIASTVLSKQFSNNISSKRFFKPSKSKTRLFAYGLTCWNEGKGISDILFEKELNGTC